jgi:4a-hydroxytetrahydrobiopterin dehydratase
MRAFLVWRPTRSLLELAASIGLRSSPCGIRTKVLTAKELRAIMPRLSGWKLAQNKLSRTFEFQDFVQSLSFVNSLVAYFETVDHHPDVRIAYGEVTFELTRYDLGGKVTDRDVEVAKKISSLYRARS